MKCKECNTVDCPFRTTDAEKECQFQSSVIQVPDEWQGVRIQAAIAAMQGFITHGFSGDSLPNDRKEARQYLARTCVGVADALIEELKKK